jgi:hypothetical protein
LVVQDAARTAVEAAQRVSSGDFEKADRDLATAEKQLKLAAKQTQDTRERKRLEEAASGVSAARQSAQAVSAAPAAARPAAQKDAAKSMNRRAMSDLGY